MKYDEFSFFNQQLAAMLREGIPLEGALRQLSADMSHGTLRTELQLLEADLAKGMPLKAALAARKLPEFYVQMLEVGVAGNDLPGVLVMLADHYQRGNLLWTRLKGLMVYPVIVLFAGFALSIFIACVFLTLLNDTSMQVVGLGFPALANPALPPAFVLNLIAPPVLIGLLLFLVVLALTVPRLRRELRWRLPAFKEANLAQLAGAMWLVLKNGGNLGDAIKLMQTLEAGNKAGRELASWHARLADGRGKFSELARPGSAFPPLFIWLVTNAGEDLASGFQRAAEIYGARATYRIELFLYASLPLFVLALGGMVICQIWSVAGVMARFLNGLG